MRSEVLMAVTAQTVVFWIAAPCSLQVITNILVENATSIFRVKRT
jgi:hypothetical protein